MSTISRGTATSLPAALLLLLIASLAGPVEAHLLNMSKARIELQPAGKVELRLNLDLLVTAGSREAYFALSQKENPLARDEVRELLAPLPGAIELTLGGLRVPLELRELRFPQEPQEVFLDPLRWPRTELVLAGDLAQLTKAPLDTGLRVTYTDGFRFEEPIASSFFEPLSERSQTRWLVTGQTSPVFDARGWYTGSADTPVREGVDWFGVLDFLRAGFLHILPGGVDHLLFVAGLCLGAASLKRLVAIVSLFTLAHSLTLCAMALGWVRAPSQFVETMILLSILWVAVTNLRSQASLRSRWPIVLCFGLLHGLGFAGALMELGLPSNQLIPALIAFNLGVEFGQLAFLSALLLLLFLPLTRRRKASFQAAAQAKFSPLPVTPLTRQIGAALIGLCALILLAERLG